MQKTQTLSKKMAKDYIDKVLKQIEEKEHQRQSLPKPELTDLEFEVLVGISQGRSNEEINNAIKKYEEKTCYSAVVRKLFRKFEAFTIAHVIYKAMKVGLLD